MFEVKLIGQFSTSMHGSAEGHNCYVFRRISIPSEVDAAEIPCDPLFSEAWKICKNGGFDAVKNHVAAKVDRFFR